MNSAVKVELSGSASVTHAPERAVLTIQVRCKTDDQTSASSQVETTASMIQAELRAIAPLSEQDRSSSHVSQTSAGPQFSSPSQSQTDRVTQTEMNPSEKEKQKELEAKAQLEAALNSPIVRWSSSAMLTMIHHEYEYINAQGQIVDPSSTSYTVGGGLFGGSANGRYAAPSTTGYTRRDRKAYSASVNMNVRFRDFARLAVFTTALATVPHVTVQSVQWVLTRETQSSLQLGLIEQAYADAHQKAMAFARAMSKNGVRPTNVSQRAFGGQGVHGGGNSFGGGLFGSSAANASAAAAGSAAEKTQTLAFVPEDIVLQASCECVFEAE